MGVDIYQSKISTPPQRRLVSRKFLASVEDESDILSFPVHVLLAVEANKSGNESEQGMITSHANLRMTRVRRTRT